MRAHPLALFAVALLVGCSGSSPTSSNLGAGGGGGSGGGPTASVTIRDFSFGPASLTIKAGGTVTWTNNGPSSHSVVSDAQGAFDSGTLAPPMASMDPYGGMSSGASYQMSFSTPGTYAYHCAFHASMHGTITVQ